MSQTKNALHLAAERGDIEQVKDLIENNIISIDSQTEMGSCALHFAAYNGHLNVIEYLVKERGFDINCENITLATPLHFACRVNNLETIAFLVNLGAVISPDILVAACSLGVINVVKFLFKLKPDLNINYEMNYCFPLYLASFNGDYDLCTFLLEHGADVKQKVDNLSSFHMAVNQNKEPICKLLIDNGFVYQHDDSSIAVLAVNEDMKSFLASVKNSEIILVSEPFSTGSINDVSNSIQCEQEKETLIVPHVCRVTMSIYSIESLHFQLRRLLKQLCFMDHHQNSQESSLALSSSTCSLVHMTSFREELEKPSNSSRILFECKMKDNSWVSLVSMEQVMPTTMVKIVYRPSDAMFNMLKKSQGFVNVHIITNDN